MAAPPPPPKPEKNGRAAKFPVGLAGGGRPDKIGQVERRIPNDEPPPWPVNSELAVVGKPTPRLDGRLKVTGAAKYTADVRLPSMLYGRVVRAAYPHALIVSIDTRQAEQHPGV